MSSYWGTNLVYGHPSFDGPQDPVIEGEKLPDRVESLSKDLEEAKKLIDSISKVTEGTLNGFQRDLVCWQRQFNMCWNLLNTIVRVLEKKGLLTEQDVVEAGLALHEEASKVGPADGMANLLRKTVSGR